MNTSTQENENLKHTKSEWTVSKTINDYTVHSEKSDVALVYRYSRGINKQEAQANALLIAAAPELLAACMAVINATHDKSYMDGAIEMCEAAVNNATDFYNL